VVYKDRIYLQDNSRIISVPNYNNDIQGWIRAIELTWLYWVAKEMDNIVEVGCWKGRSTDALLAGCTGTVWAVDHFKGSPNESLVDWAKTEDIHKTFMKNVGHHKNLKLLRMDSLKAAGRFKDKSIDMVFIDAGHEYEEVKADIKAWLPKTKKLICGHDYGVNFEGVKRAVDELFGAVNAINLIWKKPIKEVS